MEISVIASGSNGNCCFIEKNNTSIIIDAGKSGRELEERMNSLGKSLDNVDAAMITHSHHDHVCGAGVISRRHNIPLYMTKDVFSETRHQLGKISAKFFDNARKFRIKGIEINPVTTSHNVPSCGFVIGKFGLFTDTGMVTRQMRDAMPKLKAVLLESNHDIDMLINGHYPAFLKQWILSDWGHLSNVHASSLINEKGNNMSLALLGHLSENNNTPHIAGKTFETIVRKKIEFEVCSREKVSGSWSI